MHFKISDIRFEFVYRFKLGRSRVGSDPDTWMISVGSVSLLACLINLTFCEGSGR